VKRNRISLTVLAPTAALMLASCGSSNPGSSTETDNNLGLVSNGFLTVCTDAPYKPFEYPEASAPSGYTGFDMELVDAIAANLDLDVIVKDLGFDGLQSGASLAAGQCDMVASAMTITDEREENLDFTDAYYDSKQSLLAPAGSQVASLEDMGGLKLGVQQGTTGADYAKTNVSGDVDLVSFPSDAELYAALTSGGVAAVLQDLPVNLAHTADGQFTIVEEYDTGEQYGFAVSEEGSDAFLDQLNSQLRTLTENGTYDQLYAKYFGS
jgi:polar amino acid transport system substrate-binding protein